MLYACGGSDTNKAPTITLNDEYAVTEYSDITISAEAADSDGKIISYQWQQKSGLNVDLSEPGSSTLSFTAPNVSEEQQLTFELTVTDNDNALSTKEITVRLQVLAGDIEDLVFTDDNFKQCVFDNALAHNWHLPTDFTELTCTNEDADTRINSVDGLTAFVNITYLNLGDNQLRDIDLSAQTQLTSLDLGDNWLQDIDLSAQTKLTSLDLGSDRFSGNNLKNIDLSAQTQLTKLNLRRSKITDIY